MGCRSTGRAGRWIGAALAVAAGVLPAPVLAAPPPFEGLHASCTGIGATILTSPGNGLFTPAFIEGTNDLFIPYLVDVRITASGEAFIVEGAKSAPLPGATVTCSLDTTLHIDGTSYVFSGTMTGVIVGMP